MINDFNPLDEGPLKRSINKTFLGIKMDCLGTLKISPLEE